MNASSLLPPAPAAPQGTPKPAPAVLTPEQLARRKAIAVSISRDTLLRKVLDLKTQFEAGVADIQKLLDANPHGLTRAEVLASLSPEQQQAFGLLADWAQAGLAAFTPAPAPSPAPASDEAATPVPNQG